MNTEDHSNHKHISNNIWKINPEIHSDHNTPAALLVTQISSISIHNAILSHNKIGNSSTDANKTGNSSTDVNGK